MSRRLDPEKLEEVYDRYTRREYIDPDPLQWLYRYRSKADREVAGLVAAGLAYGRVAMINRNVEQALKVLGPHPAAALRDEQPEEWAGALDGFQHRWTTAGEMAALFTGIRGVLRDWGSLNACFNEGFTPGEDLCAGLAFLVAALNREADAGSLLASPDKGSACKRMMMYLRWMVRRDAVDPGCWKGVPTSFLVYPLDTHIFAISRRFGLTRRKQANWKTALEITRRFATWSPDDPVRYDFALARLGIREDARVEELG